MVTTDRGPHISWLLAGALIVGAGLRFYGLDFGLPHTQARPDEGVLLHRALSVASGDLNPHFFNYPSLHIYVTAIACGLYYLLQLVTGSIDGSAQFVARFVADPSELYLLGRSISAFYGIATIVVCAHLANRICGRRAAEIAAWLLSMAFLHVRDSHFLAVDIAATFWGLLSVALMVNCCRPGSRNSWAAALALGLAISSKYSLALFLPALIYVGIGRHPQSLRSGCRESLMLLSVATAAFFITSPYVLLDVGSFLEDLTFEARHFGGGHGINLGNGWIYHLTVSLGLGLGWPLLLTSIAGLTWFVRQRTPEGVVLALACIGYFAVAGAGGTLFVRYGLPLVPLLCVTAAAWVSTQTRFHPRVGLAITILLLLVPGSRSIEHVALLARTDSRLLAAEWIESHISDGSVIAISGTDYSRPLLPPTRDWLAQRLSDVQENGHTGRRLRIALEVHEHAGPRYEILEVRAQNPQNLKSVVPPSLDTLIHRGAEWLLLPEHPLAYAETDAELLKGIRDAREVWRLQTIVCDNDEIAFDPIDAYFLPLTAHQCITHPGPSFRLLSLAGVAQPGEQSQW